MKLTRTKLKSLILEVLWEGDVVQGPWDQEPEGTEDGFGYDEERTSFVLEIENQIIKKVSETYGPVHWPVEKIEQLDNLMDGLQDLLTITDTDA